MAEDKMKGKGQSVQVDINPDSTPIYYTDNINIAVNEDGVVLNFCQIIAPGKLKVVSRIGMSGQHAKKFVNKLGAIILQEQGVKQSGSGIKN